MDPQLEDKRMAAAFDFQSLQSARQAFIAQQQKLQAEIQKLEGERAKLVREREEIASAPITNEELSALLGALIDRQADEYHGAFAQMFGRLKLNASKLASLDDPSQIDPERALLQLPRRKPNDALPVLRAQVDPDIPSRVIAADRVLDGALFYVLREQIKEGVHRAVAELDLPKGLPMAERKDQLEKLDTRIEKLDEQITALRDGARTATASL